MMKKVLMITVFFYFTNVYAGIEFGMEAGYSRYEQDHLGKVMEYSDNADTDNTNILIHRMDKNISETLNNLFINFSYKPAELPAGIAMEAGYNGLPELINNNYYHHTDDIQKETYLIKAYYICAGIFFPVYIIRNKLRARPVFNRVWGISIYDYMIDYLRSTDVKNSFRYISRNTGYQYGMSVDYLINKNTAFVLGFLYQTLVFDDYSDNNSSVYYYEDKEGNKEISYLTEEEYLILKKDSLTKEITHLKINFSGINIRMGMRFVF